MSDRVTEGKGLSRKAFGEVALAAAGATVALALGESHKDYSNIGFDPEIQDALEREGISGDINLRIYVGNHYFTEETAEKMEDQGVTVLTGEIESNPLSHTPEVIEPGSLIHDFIRNLKKLPNGVTAFDQMRLSQERSSTLLRNFSENRAVLISDSQPGVYTQTAANKVITGLGLVGTLAYLSEIARVTKIVTEFNRPITRRDFLKKLGKGGLGLMLLHITSAAYTTAEDRELIKPPGNCEVSYLFSKLFKSGIDASTKYLELTEDEKLVQAFESLVSVRDKIMSLNNWYLIGSLERNKEVKEKLKGADGNVEIGFFAGFGHASVKSEFCKRPKVLGEELELIVTDWLSQYKVDMDSATTVAEKEKVLNYYTGLVSIFDKPQLVGKQIMPWDNMETEEYIPVAQTPAAIMYRTLIEKIGEEQSSGIMTGIYTQLIGRLLEGKVLNDGTHYNVSGINVLSNGEYHGEMVAKDPDALKQRFVDSDFISLSDLEHIEGELYPNLYNYEYIGPVIDKNVSVGLAIVRGIPMTFFQKEDTSFIKPKP